MIALFDVECEQQRFIKVKNRNDDNILYYKKQYFTCSEVEINC